MAYREISLSGSISQAAMSGNIAQYELSGSLNTALGTSERDYEKLLNKPKINGVELVSDTSFEELGLVELSASEVYKILDDIWKG